MSSLPQDFENMEFDDVVGIFKSHPVIFKDLNTLPYIKYLLKYSIAEDEEVNTVFNEVEQNDLNTFLYLVKYSVDNAEVAGILLYLLEFEIFRGIELNQKDMDMFMLLASLSYKKRSTQLLNKLVDWLEDAEEHGYPVLRLDREDYQSNNMFHYLCRSIKKRIENGELNAIQLNYILFFLKQCNLISVEDVNKNRVAENEEGKTPLDMIEEIRSDYFSSNEEDIQAGNMPYYATYSRLMEIHKYMEKKQEEDSNVEDSIKSFLDSIEQPLYIEFDFESLDPVSPDLDEQQPSIAHQTQEPQLDKNIALKEDAHFINGFIKSRIRVNITKTTEFYDVIMNETNDVNIGDYLEEDLNNIVIVYDTNKYFLTNRTNIQAVIQDAMVYPCRIADSLSPQSVDTSKALFNMRKIAFPSGYYSDIHHLISNPSQQMFALVVHKNSYPSFVSKKFYHNITESAVGALHCQSGQDSHITTILPAYPSVQDNPETLIMNESNLPQQGGRKKPKKKTNKKKQPRRIKSKNKKRKKQTKRRKPKRNIKKYFFFI